MNFTRRYSNNSGRHPALVKATVWQAEVGDQKVWVSHRSYSLVRTLLLIES